MVDNSIPKNIETHSTNVQVIHSDASWSSGIINIFIYGIGALRISLLKGGGTPTSRAFIFAITIGVGTISQAFNNAINDPKDILSHIESWKTIWDRASDSSTLNNNFIPDGNGMDDLSNKILSFIMDIFIPFLKPVKVSYSNELLATQLYGISLILFILCILLIILLIAFMVNLLIYIKSDRIINYFTNKYIKWYVNLNKKIIGFELFFIGFTILYTMYILTNGIHFLATHPITFN